MAKFRIVVNDAWISFDMEASGVDEAKAQLSGWINSELPEVPCRSIYFLGFKDCILFDEQGQPLTRLRPSRE